MIIALMLIGASGVLAQNSFTRMETRGVIDAVAVPEHWQTKYHAGSDVIVMLEPKKHQVMVFPFSDTVPATVVRKLLSGMGGSSHAQEVRTIELGGSSAASVQVESSNAADDWILAFRRNAMVVALWAKTSEGLEGLRPVLSRLVASTEVNDPRTPDKAIGTYRTQIQVEAEEQRQVFDRYVTLHADGTVTLHESAPEGSPSEDDDGAQAEDSGARWEMRGNRLLYFDDTRFYNYRVELARDGLTLRDSDGRALEWERYRPE
jgi:hypothetical protein